MIRLILVLLVVLVVAGAALETWTRFLDRDSTSPRPSPSTASGPGVRGIFVEPDDGREPVLSELRAAETSIDLLIYLLTDDQIMDALFDAESRGVEVRVILEEHPFGGTGNPEETVDRLRKGGADVRWASRRFSFSHVKTIVVDRSVALIMTLNLTRSSFERNRDFGVVTTVPADVASAQAIFEADWDGEVLANSESLIVSPDNSRSALLGLIDSASETLEIYAEVIRDDEIIQRLLAAESRGVAVEIVMTPDADPVNQRVVQALLSGGVEVLALDEPYIHAKMVVADGERAFLGSQNFTETSLDENREVGIVLVEPILLERLDATFDRDAELAQSRPAA